MPRPKKTEPRADLHVVIDQSVREKLDWLIRRRHGTDVPAGAYAQWITEKIVMDYGFAKDDDRYVYVSDR